MDSQSIIQQIQSKGSMPDFRSSIAAAYEDPVIKPIVGESAKLNAQWLPTIFNTITSMGTGAGDMSAAAKLALIGEKLGTLGGTITANKGVQDFYRNTVDNLANTAATNWTNDMTQLWKRYDAAYGKEQADRNYNLQLSQLAKANTAPSFPAMDFGGVPTTKTLDPKVVELIKQGQQLALKQTTPLMKALNAPLWQNITSQLKGYGIDAGNIDFKNFSY